ncbi:MAG: DNA polymerase III subunit beta [Flavobacteriales bacterium]|jgi:DNA polymerase-3 subunit beta|nr:DNA polymerase III subunit beta [Flavobacteriales bacterium]MDC0909465.1 DNA polymerase III subunit beta [Flavobacteriales bacterium]MDC3390077.1 DNA polymerase III subunit beta [Flavobacteriales bacterium]|tara:strand:- start:1361 stop:2479 length:1119 start_codon:yes stop_codon:yes gene_type:complete
MKFIVNSTALLRELQKLNSVISSNNTLPILDNFLFEINEGNMAVTASDLEVTMKVAISVESEFDGRITIPARILIDTLKTFSNQPLTFVINLTNYSIEIISELGNYKLSGNNADEFPKSPTLTNSSSTFFKSEILQNAINKTLFASGNDDLRPVMSGVYCELSPEQVTFVATDAHKLVKHSRNDLSSDKTASLILPKKPLTILKNNIVDGIDVKLDFNDTNALFSFENNTIICRLIDGKYPNYDAVIPKENPNKLTIETSLLLSSIKRISIYANKTTHQIRLKVSGSELQISSEDLDFSNKADERLPCHYEGEDIEIGFNSKFVIDMLNNIGSNKISLEMSAPNRAGIILPLDGTVEGENTLMLVMPVMLNN